MSIAVAPTYRLPQGCTTGQIPSWNGTAWSCGTDANTTYNTGTGLDLSGTTFSVEPTYRLPQSCSTNQIAKWNGSAWACQAPLKPGRDPSEDCVPAASTSRASAALPSRSVQL